MNISIFRVKLFAILPNNRTLSCQTDSFRLRTNKIGNIDIASVHAASRLRNRDIWWLRVFNVAVRKIFFYYFYFFQPRHHENVSPACAEYEMWEIIEGERCITVNIDGGGEIIKVPAGSNIYRRKVAMKLELESIISQLRNNWSNEHIRLYESGGRV